MPVTVWLLLAALILVFIGSYVTEAMIRMAFFILAFIVAAYAVVRLTGIG